MKSKLKIRHFILPCILLFISNSILCQTTQGPKDASTFANVALTGSSTSWLNTANASASDDVYVTIPLNGLSASGQYTDYFQASNFGFTIPGGATINGILVEIERGDVNNAKDHAVSIVKGGTVGSEDKSVNPAWSSEAYIPYGGSTDLWSETWTAADINASNFGVVFSAKKQGGGANPTPQIDHVRITIDYSAPLPVELTNFSVEQDNNIVKINWTTESEINNDYFSIEKSRDAENWETIKQIISAGNSVETLNYSEIDRNPYPGISYYRLKIVDIDRSYEYSDLAVITTEYLETDVNVTIFPNPASKTQNELTVKWESPASELAISIHDNMGQNLYRKHTSIYGLSTDINVENLGPGVYYIILNDGSRVKSLRFVRTE